MRQIMTRALAALALFGFALIPSAALAANVFYGLVEHVSSTNIKVENPRSGQVLSFDMFPKFDEIFSADGKTTYQMKDIREGHYVGVIYDQKGLGLRHADKIYLLTNRNQVIHDQFH
jgi:hypothetical protein